MTPLNTKTMIQIYKSVTNEIKLIWNKSRKYLNKFSNVQVSILKYSCLVFFFQLVSWGQNSVIAAVSGYSVMLFLTTHCNYNNKQQQQALFTFRFRIIIVTEGSFSLNGQLHAV